MLKIAYNLDQTNKYSKFEFTLWKDIHPIGVSINFNTDNIGSWTLRKLISCKTKMSLIKTKTKKNL